MTPRPALAAAVLVLTLGLSACGSTGTVRPAASGYAIADPVAAQAATDKAFTADIKTMERNVAANLDMHLVNYTHGRFGKKSQDSDFAVTIVPSKRSRDVTYYAQTITNTKHADSTLDRIHVAGSPYDYLLLGPFFSSIAPTGWVRRRAIGIVSQGTFCGINGLDTLCDLDVLPLLPVAGTAGATRQVTTDADGTTTLVTGVPVRDLLLKSGIANLPPSITSTFSPAALSTQLVWKMVLDAKYRLKLVEISGTVPGRTPLTIQDGVTIDGSANPSTIPKLPAIQDVTVLATEAELARWEAALTRLAQK